MIIKILQTMNWVDIFILILTSRIVYSAVKKGFILELFKFLGCFMATYLALHYYTRLGSFLNHLMPGPPTIPLEFWDFLSLVVLSLLGYAVFWVVREAVSRSVKMEAVSTLNRWGASFLGVARGILATSLVLFIFLNPTLLYFRNSVLNSYFGSRFVKVAPNAYHSAWYGIMSKFVPGEEFNQSVLEIQGNQT